MEELFSLVVLETWFPLEEPAVSMGFVRSGLGKITLLYVYSFKGIFWGL